MKGLYLAIIIALSSLIFTGCEYSIDYYFEVDNQLDEDVRLIFVTIDDSDNLNFSKEKDIMISSHKKERISEYWGGVGGSKVKAGDPFSPVDLLPPMEPGSMKMYIGNELLDVDRLNKLMQRKYWEYHPDGQSTTYVLILNEELLERIVSEKQ